MIAKVKYAPAPNVMQLYSRHLLEPVNYANFNVMLHCVYLVSVCPYGDPSLVTIGLTS